ncbi:MAG: steroid delta-isomerase [Rickettsiales bacterium]|nr:steroid delta-isomerase [Rickettsiales bacterium]|tara:strand:+ start:924 stop:1265 length:342 start_codon:yes stop_codon:yes gene_type:complete
MAQIADLAARQLAAYNAADLDAFVACYHEDVQVMDGEEQTLRGRQAFRERYRELFEDWSFGAEVEQRLQLGVHCIDYERWWRIAPDSKQREQGLVMVRYLGRDGLIGLVQFLD